MSAVKLEKKVAALERRLQNEMRFMVQPLAQKIDHIEEKLRRLDDILPGKLALAEQPEPMERAEAEPAEKPGGYLVPGTVPVVPTVVHPEGVGFAKWKEEVNDLEGEGAIDEEPIPFAETVWNLSLVLGHSRAGWLDLTIACLVTVLGTLMQVFFIAVITTESFLGESMEEQVEAARHWRAGSAHDVKYMDLALTSLVSRVCNADGALILSTGQAELIEEINQFLGIDAGDFQLAMVPPGIVLCTLCIMLWCVVLSGELRAIGISIVAAAQIPRSGTTVVRNGSFLSISYLRFSVYLLFRLARTAVAISLMYAGTQWLARTTNITDLILNAVALEAILQIDEMIFTMLFPKRVQAAIYELEPVKVRFTRRWGQLESCLVGCLFVVVVLAPFISWVLPLADSMLAVKSEYCDGNRDFVVSLNQDMQMYMGFRSVPLESDNVSDSTLGQVAVAEHSKGSLSNGSARYISFSLDLDSFELSRVRSMKEAAEQFAFCLDYDQWAVKGPTLLENYGSYFRSAAFHLGRSEATSCSELSQWCNVLDARLLRLVCPRTCGCADPRALPWYKVPSQGCPQACRDEANAIAGNLECKDANTTENWHDFWDLYPTVMSSLVGVDMLSTPSGQKILALIHMMKSIGCLGIFILGSRDPISQADWCEGSERYFAPLALVCPDTCGCLSESRPAYCPASCRGCGDAPNFPPSSAATNCEEAKLLGICSIPTEAEQLCAETCGLCNGTNSSNMSNTSAAPCFDGDVPGAFGFNCSTLQVNGWCPMLIAFNSPASKVCSKTCGLCT